MRGIPMPRMFFLPPSAVPAARRGFSLLDILITLTIMGIVAMIALPGVGELVAGARLDGAAMELASAYEYAADLAVRYGRPFGLEVSSDRNGFCVYDARYRTSVDAHLEAVPPVYAYGIVVHPVVRDRYDRVFSRMSEFAGVRIARVAGGSPVEFYPDGHASLLTQRVTLMLGTSSRGLELDGGTGRIQAR